MKRINIVKDFIAGFGRGVNFKTHTYFSSGMKPSFLHINVTSKCNAKCSICNIWQSSSQNDISINDFESIFSSPLLSDLTALIVTGGEPFLRNDLPNIFEIVAKRQKRIQDVQINTNGLLTNIIISQTNKILNVFDNKMKLRIGISFDGIGEKHDEIRNIKGIHSAALNTAKSLQELNDERLLIQSHIVIGPYNIHHLEEMYLFYSNIFKKINWSPVIVSNNYFNNREKSDELSFNSEDKIKLKEFLKRIIKEELVSPSNYYYSRLMELLETGRRTWPCTGGYRYMEIDSEGNVKPCQLVPQNMNFGNIRQKPLEEIWLSKESNEKRKRLKKLPMCKNCTSDCDMFSVIREEFFDFITFLIRNPIIFTKMLRRYF